MTDENAFLGEAEAIVGSRGFTRDADIIEPWLTDWRGRYSGQALALISPANTSETAEIIRLCVKYQVPIVPQGGNSGMSGGATPDESGESIILSLRRMNAIEEIDAEAGRVLCGAGVVLQNLHDAAEAKGLRFPLTLGGKGSATIGGLISTNAGGTQVLRHGTMRAQILGIEAVLPDGSIFDSLTVLKKDNRGFDLKQLFIGSEGTMGLVTKARLRLISAIDQRVVIWAGLKSITDARQLLVQLEQAAGPDLEGFEVLPDRCLDAVLNYLPDARAPLSEAHNWNALIEFAASGERAEGLMDKCETLLGDAIESGLIDDAVIAANETQAEAFWQLRESISPAEKAIGPAMQHDISVPVEKMADFIAMAVPEIENKFSGTQAICFGHLGDGNVHFHVLAPIGAIAAEWEASQGQQVSCFVDDLVTQWGGSISAEHGIGKLKLGELERLGDPVSLSLMRQVKQAIDPLRLMNPGKLIPPA